ncbi:hypothetical protein BD626DRAFT_576196 [Schizophyllum amplum]|uniref:ATP-dependent DNA helicase n=1 Tax=Schizophyllum amplum TaxID=97359 RepID=A0A550BU14_9AGAR|nr:hypothetical protein BD626DRAFT_576196 [Auriculariopsis ampla]
MNDEPDARAQPVSRQPRLEQFFRPQVDLAAHSDQTEMRRASLNQDQAYILDLVGNQRQNVFYTGAAGTGKSLLLRALISLFRKRYAGAPARLAITASTGVAAANVGGCTIHSWAGFPATLGNINDLLKRLRGSPAGGRWLAVEVLIIDEDFVHALNALRLGQVPSSACSVIQQLQRRLPLADVEATDLFPRRYEVDKANFRRLKSLPGVPHAYMAIDGAGGSGEEHSRRLKTLEGLPALLKLTVKVGAQVMLVRNVDESLVNGTTGVVLGFHQYGLARLASDRAGKCR